MFRLSFILLLTTVPTVFNQFITFKDGNVGVNFAGYHASAGLGGLLTGNAAHGGLQASAGTPFGQKAGAGLGGTVDNGRTRGGLYAGATAGNGVGASAALGGNVDESGGSGGLGSEAHAGGFNTKTVKLSQTPQLPQQDLAEQQPPLADAPVVSPVGPSGKRFYKRKYKQRINDGKTKVVESRYDAQSLPQNNFDYTKFFDFGFFSNMGANFAGAPHPSTQPKQTNEQNYVFNIQKQLDPNTVYLHKTIIPRRQAPASQVKTVVKEVKELESDDGFSKESEVGGVAATSKTVTKQIHANPSFFNDIFNIPISTLGAVNQFLNNNANGQVAVTKTKTVEKVH